MAQQQQSQQEEDVSGTLPHQWRLPFFFLIDLDFSICRYSEDTRRQRCIALRNDTNGGSIIEAGVPEICHQCYVRLVGHNSLKNQLMQHSPGPRGDVLFMITIYHTNDLWRVLLRKELLHRYMAQLQSTTQLPSVRRTLKKDDLDTAYFESVWKILHFVALKRRFVRWFIEMGNGSYFKELIVDRFNEFQSGPWNILLPIIGHFLRHSEYYIRKAPKRKYRNKGMVRKNYEWIEKNMNCIQESWEWNFKANKLDPSALKLILANKVVCDNPQCKRVHDSVQQITLKRCKGCLMMHYCSRRCQKIDWNKYNHRSLCFYKHRL